MDIKKGTQYIKVNIELLDVLINLVGNSLITEINSSIEPHFFIIKRELPFEKLEPANIYLTESELIYISKVCHTDKGVKLLLKIKELFVIR